MGPDAPQPRSLASLRHIRHHSEEYTAILLWCPGCNLLHMLPVTPSDQKPHWQWNNDLINVTVEPSILTTGHEFTCHAFLRNGMWQFLDDSTHRLKGTTVPMVELPLWVSKG